MTEDRKRKLLAKAADQALSPEERSEIEHAMQEDHFLKEAYLGYLKNEENHADQLSELRSILVRRTDKPSRRILWRQIAAAATLLLVAGAVLWNIPRPNASDQVATVFEEESEQPATSSLEAEEAGGAVEDQAIAFEPQQNARLEPLSQEEKTSPVTLETKSEKKTEDPGQAGELAAAADNDLAQIEVDQLSTPPPPIAREAHNSIVASGRVTDANFDPLPGVQIAFLNSQKVGRTDSAGKFHLQLDPAQKYLTFETAGQQQLIIPVERAIEQDLAMQPVDRQRPASFKRANDQGASAKSQAAPAKEWIKPKAKSSFELFVDANRIYPAEAELAGIIGDVTLNFTLDRSGRPDLFYLQHSPHPACTEESIRLLREGPAWEVDPGRQLQSVVIPCKPR